MRKWLENQKLARKIFFLVFLMGMSLFLTEMVNRQKIYNSCQQKINEQNAQILNFYVNYMTTVFDRIEATTYAIAGDQNLQKELLYIKEYYHKLGYSFNLRSANSRIRTYFQKEPYFKYFCCKTDVYQFSYGGLLATEDELNQYFEYGKNAMGKLLMIEEEGRLLLVRELRKMTDTEYEHVGYIYAEIDFEGIIKDMRESFSNHDSRDMKLAVYAEDICLYSNSEQLAAYQNYQDGWYSEGNEFVVVYTPPELGYTMILQDNYTEIQNELHKIYASSLLTSFVIVILIVAVSNYLIKRVIGQLEGIVVKMDDYGKGILFSKAEVAPYLKREDEIGRLYRHFYRMTDDYKRLTDAYYENKMALKEMEFSWLQKQIQPHLLYNTLSAVSWMAYSNGDDETAQMVEILGKMMRMITDQKENMISVEQDLQIAEDYISLQKLRFGSRLSFSADLSEETRKRRIPRITIQPLVENSVIHGLDEMISDCAIHVYERVYEDSIEIVVEDNGSGFDEEILKQKEAKKGKGSGIALKNIQCRLQYVFHGKSNLRFVRTEGGMQVCFQIPKIEEQSAVEDVRENE